MAFIDQEKKKQEVGQNTSQPLGAFSGSAPFGGGSQGASAGQSGSGGAGGKFSNIQSYLSGNAGADSSGVLKDEYKNTVGQDFENFQNKVSDYEQKGATNYGAAKSVLDRGAGSVEPLKSAWQKTNPELEILQGADRVPWQNDPALSGYNENAQSAANYQYNPQDAFSYNIADSSRKFGERLKDDDAFGGLMSELYGKKVGAFTPGQSLLQGQLDAANQNIGNARGDMSSEYGNFLGQVASKPGQLNSVENERAREVAAQKGAVGTNYNNLFNNINEYERRLPGAIGDVQVNVDPFNFGHGAGETIFREQKGINFGTLRAQEAFNRAQNLRRELGLPDADNNLLEQLYGHYGAYVNGRQY